MRISPLAEARALSLKIWDGLRVSDNAAVGKSARRTCAVLRVVQVAKTAAIATAWLVLNSAIAFPPAPHHLLFGLLRDEYGNPLRGDNVELIFETDSGTQTKTSVLHSQEPGVNYRLAVPMDAGITSDLYRPTAMRPTVPFKIKVKIGKTTFLPIEMIADYSRLGRPGERTRLNLTLGEDADGDGLPDAWERVLISQSGGTKTLKDIRPEDDFDRDGLSNANEYITGNYAFDDKDGFRLKAIETRGAVMVLEFIAIRGRTYTLYGSTDFLNWVPVQFRIPAEGLDAAQRGDYRATDVRPVQVEVGPQNDGRSMSFFKLQVQ